MCFFFSFIPATFWCVVGYFVLFSSTRAEGSVRAFGRGLSIWVFLVAGFIVVAGAYITLSGMCSIDAILNCAN
jgi:hypothetical protein